MNTYVKHTLAGFTLGVAVVAAGEATYADAYHDAISMSYRLYYPCDETCRAERRLEIDRLMTEACKNPIICPDGYEPYYDPADFPRFEERRQRKLWIESGSTWYDALWTQ